MGPSMPFSQLLPNRTSAVQQPRFLPRGICVGTQHCLTAVKKGEAGVPVPLGLSAHTTPLATLTSPLRGLGTLAHPVMVVPPYLWFHFLHFQSKNVKCKNPEINNSNVLNCSEQPDCDEISHLASALHHPFGQYTCAVYTPPISHLAAIWVLRLTVVVPQCLCSVTLRAACAVAPCSSHSPPFFLRYTPYHLTSSQEKESENSKIRHFEREVTSTHLYCCTLISV